MEIAINMKISFFHWGSMGDIIYSLPTVISYLQGNNESKASMCLRSSSHVNLLRPLLKSQEYIEDVTLYQLAGGEPGLNAKFELEHDSSIIDLSSKFRTMARRKKTQHLATSHLQAFDLQYDLSQTWLHFIEPNPVADIIIHRSLSYHDVEWDWDVIKPYINRCKIVGIKKAIKGRSEWNRISKKCEGAEFHETKNMLELAQVIKGSKLFIGNQSCPFAIAEAMKHPRCLEVYHKMNNCQPHGRDGHTCLTKEIIEQYLQRE